MSEIQKNKKISLEKAFSKLDKIVAKIEEQNIPLDKMINLFEEGMLLTRLCDEKLKDAEKKIGNLLNKVDSVDK